MATDVRTLMQSALAAHQAGRLAECEATCQRILRQDPRVVEALLLSGIVAAKMGRVDDAVSRLRQVVRSDSKNFTALNWLSMLVREAGRYEEAASYGEEAVALRPADPDAQNNLGLCLMFQGRFAEAAACFRLAIKYRPTQAEYHHGLAGALEQAGLTGDAIGALRTACGLTVNSEWLVQLGSLYLSEGNHQEAVKACSRALEILSGSAVAHLVISMAFEDSGDVTKADHAFQEALKHNASPAEIHRIRAIRRQSVGRFKEAREDFKLSVSFEPSQGFAYYGIVSSGRIEESDRLLVEAIEQRAAAGNLAPGETAYLHFALGKALDDLGEYKRAMEQFNEANRLLKQVRLGNRAFDQARFSKRIDDTIRTFSREYLLKKPIDADQDDLPIFVVGMMRSGTTLLEQIMSCHPKIGGAGEQSFWMQAQPQLVNFQTGVVEEMALPAAAERYCNQLKTIAQGFRHVVDKNPANFFALGLIHAAMPNARVVHVKRNPIDTCLSIYMTPVKNPPEFGCDKESIAFAYREYLRLMDHWRSVLPTDSFLELEYEDFIQRGAATTNALIEFCGLQWDDRCLHPETNLKPIRTPSFWQARQPIYATSVGRWKRYSPFLGPFANLSQ